MLKTRVIPCLLLRGRGLYKTIRFKDPTYVGDPVNAVKIFNEKEVDELILLDIGATPENREPNFDLIEDIASECFMPLTYGGGVKTVGQIRALHRLGVEKVALNSAAYRDRRFVEESCSMFGSSSVLATIDVKRNLFGKYEVWIDGGRTRTKDDPIAYAQQLAGLGVGEIMINSIDRDGMMSGYDLELLRRVSKAVETPLVACGGAGSIEHMSDAVTETGVPALAAGSMFVFHGRHRAVLISYPTRSQLEARLP